jgi:hypothetical protein
MLTAYDATMAGFFDRAGIDVLLVGDSLGHVILGSDTTIPVTLDAILHHRTGRPTSSAPALRWGCSLMFTPGWEVDAAGGAAGFCQPVERDIYDRFVSCYWPAQVPNHLNNAPDWTTKCAATTKDWRNLDLVFPQGISHSATATAGRRLRRSRWFRQRRHSVPARVPHRRSCFRRAECPFACRPITRKSTSPQSTINGIEVIDVATRKVTNHFVSTRRPNNIASLQERRTLRASCSMRSPRRSPSFRNTMKSPSRSTPEWIWNSRRSSRPWRFPRRRSPRTKATTGPAIDVSRELAAEIARCDYCSGKFPANARIASPRAPGWPAELLRWPSIRSAATERRTPSEKRSSPQP